MNPSQSTDNSSISASDGSRALGQSNLLQTELSLIASSGGFAAPILLDPKLANVVTRVLADPITLRKLSDRVFELLRQDLRRQQERNPGPYP